MNASGGAAAAVRGARTVVSGGLPEISLGRSVNYVADTETLDGFVLGARAAAVAAPDGVDMASAMFGAAGVPAFRRHPFRFLPP